MSYEFLDYLEDILDEISRIELLLAGLIMSSSGQKIRSFATTTRQYVP